MSERDDAAFRGESPPEKDAFLGELRSAWTDVRPPETGELDDRTRAVVGWLRGAWSTLEAPEPRVPARRTPRLRVRPWRARVTRLAAAAAVLLAAVLGWRELQRSGAPVRLPEDGGSVVEPVPAAATGPRVASLGPDHVELRSGPVRLILLDGTNQGEPR